MKKLLLAMLAALALGTVVAQAAEETKKDTYPLTTCVVSGEKLGEMGKPYIMQHEGREVRFCCKMCRKDFLKDPAKYLKIIDDAAAAQNAADATKPKAKADTSGHEHHNHD